MLKETMDTTDTIPISNHPPDEPLSVTSNFSHPIQHYEPRTSWFCCTTYKDRSYFQNVMEHIDLSPTQKQIIQARYLHILEND
jgi:hypothetical protein